LGYPIVNDPLYNRTDVWGKGNGKDGKYEFTKEEIEQNFLNVYTYEAWIIKQETEADTAENETPKEENDNNESKSKRKEIEEKEREQSSDSNKKLKSDSEVEIKIQPKHDSCKNEDAQKSAKVNSKSSTNRPGLDPNRFERDPECFECAQTYRDPTRKDLIMYLHAYSYQFDDLKFNTELPEWAHEDFCEPEDKN
jgi:hypothetical protein